MKSPKNRKRKQAAKAELRGGLLLEFADGFGRDKMFGPTPADYAEKKRAAAKTVKAGTDPRQILLRVQHMEVSEDRVRVWEDGKIIADFPRSFVAISFDRPGP